MKIGVIGLGTIGEIFVRGLTNAGKPSENLELFVYDRNSSKNLFSTENYGATTCKDEMDCIAKSDWIFLCVKPKDIKACVQKFAPAMKPSKALLSTIAGVDSKTLNSWIPGFQRTVRLMPNTPCSIQKGLMITWYPEGFLSTEREELRKLLLPLGLLLEFPEEKLMHLATAVCGSGPAYLYYFAQSLQQASIQEGLAEDLARKMVTQMLLGSCEMLLTTEQEFSDLIDAVKTPRGTTEAALNFLEENHLGKIIEKAVKKAIERGVELSKSTS